MTAATFANAEAERDVVGGCILSSASVEAVVRQLTPADFASTHAGHAFAAIVALHGHGVPIDVATVADQLMRQGTAWSEVKADLVAWVANVPSTGSVGRYAEIVVASAARRALHGLGVELTDAASDPTRDPGQVADETRARLAQLGSPAFASSPGDRSIDEFVRESDDLQPAVIPGLLAEDDRVVVVAPEGVGKSELARQLVVCTAAGIHPFAFSPIPAVPALLVDLENPRHLVRRRLRLLTDTAERASVPRAPAVLWHRPGGIDLRRRADRVALEDVLRRRRPKLVALGPVYKAYVRSAKESDEQVASEVQAILDDLRTRYGFALLLEHHAPQANGGARELRPFGSSLWLRWPEYGLKLTPSRDRPGVLVVGRWRGDRAEARWPDELRRDDTWPWVGWWRDDRGICKAGSV